MKIFVSAAEISSDIHAEKILRAMERESTVKGETIEWMGIGGPLVRSLPGFKAIEPAENLRTMGFVEVLRKYSFFKKLLSRTAKEISTFNPDVILTFDYPDFHFRLMESVVRGNLAPNALRVCGIPPKVWVWRSKRVEKIRKFYHGVWVIFPFEKDFYQSRGIPVIYEGNPLLNDLVSKTVHLTMKKPLETITVMPGSRDGELESHLPVIQQALPLFAAKAGKKIVAQVPIPAGVSHEKIRQFLKSSSGVEYIFQEEGSASSLKETQIGLIKSGTSTLEAVTLDCVPVIFYRMSAVSEWIFRWLIQTWGGYRGPVGLPNILLKVRKRSESIFPELLGPEASPERVAESLYALYSQHHRRESLLKRCKEVRSLFFAEKSSSSPADESAKKILKWKKHFPSSLSVAAGKTNLLLGFVSWSWSTVNYLRRRLANVGLFPVHVVEIPSILVGNLQAGGSGKTPLVIALAKEAVARGKTVAVVSRGYGSNPQNPLGDEPQEILNAVPEAILSVNADRLAAIREAEKRNPDLLIFDDGFQNLKFRTKTTLIAVTDRERNEVAYRDFDSEIRFADFVIATKGDHLRKTLWKEPFFRLNWSWENAIDRPVWLLCTVADPGELIRFYGNRGLEIRKTFVYPDHAVLDEEKVKTLIQAANEEGCVLAITEKDRVKIPTLSSRVAVLKRAISNRDWIDAVFAATLE